MNAFVKIRRVVEIDAPDLPQWLKAAADESEKAITAICGEAGISTQFWYDLIKGRRDSILESTLHKLEQALGKTYKSTED